MPYIEARQREALKTRGPEDAGELTYLLYKTAVDYLKYWRGLVGSGNHFMDYGDVILALECAKLEFYRRHVAPYEDKKIAENGDVE